MSTDLPLPTPAADPASVPLPLAASPPRAGELERLGKRDLLGLTPDLAFVPTAD